MVVINLKTIPSDKDCIYLLITSLLPHNVKTSNPHIKNLLSRPQILRVREQKSPFSPYGGAGRQDKREGQQCHRPCAAHEGHRPRLRLQLRPRLGVRDAHGSHGRDRVQHRCGALCFISDVNERTAVGIVFVN